MAKKYFQFPYCALVGLGGIIWGEVGTNALDKTAGETERYSGVLWGRADHALDDKKRFAIPREWRELLGSPKYIFAMPDRKERCVNLIPIEEMQARLGKLREKALFDPVTMRAYQTIGANSAQLKIDDQGRIRLSDRFMQFANITKAVAMIGACSMIKLWDPAALAPQDAVEQEALDEALSVIQF